jgi:hypothetical protein
MSAMPFTVFNLLTPVGASLACCGLALPTETSWLE